MISLDDEYNYDTLITVHDEVVAENELGRSVPAEFDEIMRRMPAAFIGCPITAESKVYTRYRKG